MGGLIWLWVVGAKFYGELVMSTDKIGVHSNEFDGFGGCWLK